MDDLAQYFGLNSRVKLIKIDDRHLAIVKRIKSRIIRKDAEKIIVMAGLIKSKDPDKRVSLLCEPNICSKSIALLKENDIDVLYNEEQLNIE